MAKQAKSKEMPRKKRYGIIALLLVLMFAVGIVSSILFYKYHIENFYRHALVNVNVIAFLILLLLLFRNIGKVFFERKEKFQRKLVLTFSAASLIPTILLFFFASKLITDSINNWFNPEVDEFLQGAYQVASYHVEWLKKTNEHYGSVLVSRILKSGLLQGEDPESLKQQLQTWAMEYNLDAIQIYNAQGVELIRGAKKDTAITESLTKSKKIIEGALRGERMHDLEETTQGTLVRFGIPIPSLQQADVIKGVLVINQLITKNVVDTVVELSSSYDEYQRLRISANPFKWIYIVIFLMVTLVIVFSASWFGRSMAKRVAVPVQELAEATEQIAKGNLDYKVDIKADDEIGILVDAFNSMTAELKSSRAKLETAANVLNQKNIEIEQKRAYIETVLNNISIGVLTMDNSLRISTANKAIARILDIESDQLPGQDARYIFDSPRLSEIKKFIGLISESFFKSGSTQLLIKTQDDIRTIDAHITPLKDNAGNNLGLVLMLEDLTKLVKAERAAAWQEVARRIAHEIKNPLTPIQLATERLRKKYEAQSKDFPEVFNTSTRLIVEQVEELRRMVNEFSQFARLPKANPKPDSLHEVIINVIELYKSAWHDIEFRVDFDPEITVMNIDAEQLKRVFQNIFDNSIAAMNGQGTITVKTELIRAITTARITISDTGIGIDEKISHRIFTPGFSTKGEKGSGLGLAIVGKIIHDHNGYVRIARNEPKGAKVIIELPMRERVAAIRW